MLLWRLVIVLIKFILTIANEPVNLPFNFVILAETGLGTGSHRFPA